MSKCQKKKAPIVEEEPEVEIITRFEYTYEETKCIVGVEPEYQWGGDLQINNMQRSTWHRFWRRNHLCQYREICIDEIATRPELFPCSEVIGWILPREDLTTMILANVDKQGYAAYSPGNVSLAYHLPEAQVYLT